MPAIVAHATLQVRGVVIRDLDLWKTSSTLKLRNMSHCSFFCKSFSPPLTIYENHNLGNEIMMIACLKGSPCLMVLQKSCGAARDAPCSLRSRQVMGTCTWTWSDGWGSKNERGYGPECMTGGSDGREANECQMPIWTPLPPSLHTFTLSVQASLCRFACLNL